MIMRGFPGSTPAKTDPKRSLCGLPISRSIGGSGTAAESPLFFPMTIRGQLPAYGVFPHPPLARLSAGPDSFKG
jgi:hypothetical protein